MRVWTRPGQRKPGSQAYQLEAIVSMPHGERFRLPARRLSERRGGCDNAKVTPECGMNLETLALARVPVMATRERLRKAPSAEFVRVVKLRLAHP